jgi:hypothetical protein
VELVEITMTIAKIAKIATVVTILLSSAPPVFADDGNCGVGVGSGNAKCGRTATGSVAPLPALGTGLPGLIVLAGGLFALARRRRG